MSGDSHHLPPSSTVSSSTNTPSLSRLPSTEEVNAATKIQSVYRGASIRKRRQVAGGQTNYIHPPVEVEQPPPAYLIPQVEGEGGDLSLHRGEPHRREDEDDVDETLMTKNGSLSLPNPSTTTTKSSRRTTQLPKGFGIGGSGLGSNNTNKRVSSSPDASTTVADEESKAKKNYGDDMPSGTAATTQPEPDLQQMRQAAVRIQSLYRGQSIRRMIADPTIPMPQVNQQRRECWHVNKSRRRAIELERPMAQLLDQSCIRNILNFLSFGEVARVITTTCREWLAAARGPSNRQATLVLITHPSLQRMWNSTLLSHIGAIHTSLRVCISPLALNFDLFQSYFDLPPQELTELASRFPALTELVVCVKGESNAVLAVPQSPHGIHGHLYGGRTGAPPGSMSRRILIHPADGSAPTTITPTPPPANVVSPTEEEFNIAFPKTLKTLVLELGLPVPQASKTIFVLSKLQDLSNLTLLLISELDLTCLSTMKNLRSLSIRYSNLSGKTTRLRFPRKTQYAVLRQMSQLVELELEEGYLVDPIVAHHSAGHTLAQQQIQSTTGSYLHELLLDREDESQHASHARTSSASFLPPIAGATGGAESASQPSTSRMAVGSNMPPTMTPLSPTSNPSQSYSVASSNQNAAGFVTPKIIHAFRLQHLHMEKTTLVKGNEIALVTLPSLTTLTPFRFSYDVNFSFLRVLTHLTTLHLHFSTSTSPPPPMLPLMSHLLTCRHLTELSFRGVAFGSSEQLLLLTFLGSVPLTKFRLMFCTLPSLRCIQTLSQSLQSLTLDSCVCLAMDPNHPNGGGGHAPHILFPYQDFIIYLQKMPKLQELYLNGTFEGLPYTTLQLLTYPSQFFPALKKLVLTQGSVMLSSYDHRTVRTREEITLELQPLSNSSSSRQSLSANDDEDRPPTMSRRTQRHSMRPGFNLPGLRR